MIGGVSGIGGQSGFSGQIDQIIRELGETNKIVIEIFRKADEFKTETDKAIAREMVQKAEERIEQLRARVKTLTPRLNESLTKLEQQIDDLKKQLGMAV
jgi:uncharacterized coiled-coil DUF342 family protein